MLIVCFCFGPLRSSPCEAWSTLLRGYDTADHVSDARPDVVCATIIPNVLVHQVAQDFYHQVRMIGVV